MYNILIVDDEYLSREGIKSIIKEEFKNNINIKEAINGIDARAIIDKFDLDLILLDINIPGINGIDLCRYIKSKFNKINIIITTAYDDLHIKDRVLDIGVNKYLVKPIRPQKIIESLKYILTDKTSKIKYSDVLDSIRTKDNPSNNYVKETLNYIEKNINKNITLEDAASYVNLSPHYLSKIFKKETGVNFITYLTNIRIDIAKEMLEDESIPISNIAIELSYSKSNYFSKVFKKKVGITPSEYRERYLNENLIIS
ncbi:MULTISPECIES: response regulator [unclassified Romboutsia]|uniref:response regulator n=1 Tax=unclassified Romboutsia TaxID=2626894 RepID=UPI000820B743|nr:MULTISPECIES: response regulator [unclassified Romboutsia]SCI25541.1 Uncharacterized response regulatory protein SA0215 [uncultured Clostridium sp.]